MKKNIENKWTKKICELLRKELDSDTYTITCLERVPYRANVVGYDENGKEKIEFMKYQTDLLIKEKVNNNFIPRLIIESKFENVTSHDAITYSNKALDHKKMYNGLKYGIMIAKSNKVPPRLLQHGNNFDFMFSFNSDIPSDNEWDFFVKIVKKNLKAANQYEEMINERRKKSKKNYKCIERDYNFYTMD